MQQEIQDQSQQQILQNTYENIAVSLYSVVRTLKKIPIIYYQNGKAENIAKILNKLLQNYIESKQFEEENSELLYQNTKQPCLIILERNIDLACAILHPWHYGALIHDLLTIKNNKVELTMQNKKEEYDLDQISDSFWQKYINVPFPFVSEEIHNEVQAWTQEYNQMGHKKKAQDSSNISQNLNSAIDKLPEMSEKKKKIDWHTNILTHVMNEVKSRQLDQFFEIGSDLMFNQSLQKQDKQVFANLLSDKNLKSEDKIRLLMLYFLCQKNIDLKECQLYSQYLNNLTEEQKQSMAFIKKFKNIKFEEVKRDAPEEKEKAAFNLIKDIASTMKTHGKGLLQNMQNYLPGANKNFICTSLVEQIIEGKPQQQQQIKLNCINPRSSNAQNDQRTYQEAIVFFMDGGCYNEYQNIEELSQKLEKKIIYGASNMYNCSQLLANFSKIN